MLLLEVNLYIGKKIVKFRFNSITPFEKCNSTCQMQFFNIYIINIYIIFVLFNVI